MIYTTGGMSLARVSVVDGSGKEVYDELVRLDDGVEMMFVPLSCMMGWLTH
jgi:RNA exonuclease 1